MPGGWIVPEYHKRLQATAYPSRRSPANTQPHHINAEKSFLKMSEVIMKNKRDRLPDSSVRRLGLKLNHHDRPPLISFQEIRMQDI